MSQRLPGDQRAAPPAQVRAGRGEARRSEARRGRLGFPRGPGTRYGSGAEAAGGGERAAPTRQRGG